MDGYLKWYLTISHPHIIPSRKHEDDVELSHVGGPFDDMLSLPHGADDAQCLQMITVIVDNFIALVNSYGEVYTLASQTSHLSRGGPI